MMEEPTVEFQAKVYLFDLRNCAKEYWFKEDENWDLCMVTGAEKKEIEKRFKPTISRKVKLDSLTQLHRLVKSKLTTNHQELVRSWPSNESPDEPEFLVAFNRERKR
jgi:hypothetical protein